MSTQRTVVHEPALLVHFKKGIEIYGNTKHRPPTSITHLNVAPLKERAKARLVQPLTPVRVQHTEQLLHLVLLTIERVLWMNAIAPTGT